jgi:hypothetical protein
VAEDVEPPQMDARTQRLAKQLLMGEAESPPSAWLLRADLLQRTWAWQAARRLLETRRGPTTHQPVPGRLR